MDTPIGFRDCGDTRQPVCIPLDLRWGHTLLVGRSGMGKSTTMEHMVLHDIQEGYGVAVLDPHGGLVERLLRLIPRECVDRVIYLNPGDPDWVPIWNPLLSRIPVDPGPIASDITRVFVAPCLSFGHRLEHILYQALLAILHLPDGNLRDVLDLLRRGSKQSARLISRVLGASHDRVAKQFWEHDFRKYSTFDLKPAISLLSSVLTSGPCSNMLSQRDSSFDLRDVVDSGKVLLMDLSSISSMSRDIIGRLALSLLRLTALGRRGAKAGLLRPFHIYCDEAHRFMTDTMEHLFVETRRCRLSLVLASQCVSQFSSREGGILPSFGSTIIYNVNPADAQHLKRDLQDLVQEEDLGTLTVGQAIARIGPPNAELLARQGRTEGNEVCPPDLVPQDGTRPFPRSQDRALKLLAPSGPRMYTDPLGQSSVVARRPG